jgi:hypothetical protein
MNLVEGALGAAHAGRGDTAQHPSALMIGGGGALGSAVLERLLASRRFKHVRVLVTQGFHAAMHGLEPLVFTESALHDAAVPALNATLAIVVFDHARRANGREDAFVRPRPDELPALARWLFAGGVRELVVVLPHSVASLPQALKAGLANLDEHAVAALGFDHLVFVRSARPPPDARAGQWLQRLADGVLAQMRIMVAASNQPVRAQRVAQFAVELATSLPASTPGTRIAPPELVWLAAQLRDCEALVKAWLATGELPEINAPRVRM